MANRKGSKNAGLRAEIEVALRDQRESLRDFIDKPKAARRGPRQASGATRSVWNLEVDCVAEARRLLLEWDRLVPGTFERDEILAFLRDERKAGRFPYGPADRKAAEDVIAYFHSHAERLDFLLLENRLVVPFTDELGNLREVRWDDARKVDIIPAAVRIYLRAHRLPHSAKDVKTLLERHKARAKARRRLARGHPK